MMDAKSFLRCSGPRVEVALVNRGFITGILLIASFVCSIAARAADSDITPIEIGLFPPLQLPGTSYGTAGLRLAGVGVNRTASGLDIGILGNVTDVSFSGLAIAGLFNFNRGSSVVYGLQFAGLANLNQGSNEIYGLQIAAYNSAGTVHGLQIGLINVANELHGVQIGLFNINHKGPFHGVPIINAAF
jgi:hypothetical protein